jgi:hypothetical protein
MTEGEGRREAALGRPLLSVHMTTSYASLGRKTMGGCRQALVMEHCEACGTSGPAVGTVHWEDKPEEDSCEAEVTDTCRLLWLGLGPHSGGGTSPGLCLLMTDGGP